MQRILARKYSLTPLGTGGKGEVFMAVENCFGFIFIATMQYYLESNHLGFSVC